MAYQDEPAAVPSREDKRRLRPVRRKQHHDLRGKYSPGERRLFPWIRPGRDGALTSEELTGLYYGDKKPPENARRVVSGLLASLTKKVRLNREQFRIANSGRRGQQSMTFWIEEKRR